MLCLTFELAQFSIQVLNQRNTPFSFCVGVIFRSGFKSAQCSAPLLSRRNPPFCFANCATIRAILKLALGLVFLDELIVKIRSRVVDSYVNNSQNWNERNMVGNVLVYGFVAEKSAEFFPP